MNERTPWNFVAILILAVTTLWLAVTTVGSFFPSVLTQIRSAFPRRLALAIVFAQPAFYAVACLKTRLWSLRVLAFVLLITGALFLPMSIRAMPIATMILVAILYIEGFLIIPRINARLSR